MKHLICRIAVAALISATALLQRAALQACTPVAAQVGGDIPLQLPFTGGPYLVTQGYCCTCANGDHTGYQLDFGVPTGTPLVAASAGTVVDVNDYSGTCTDLVTQCGLSLRDQGGTWVKIRHQGTTTNWYSSYLHFSSRAVNSNDTVQAGQVIGYSGNTGLSTGPHLHFHIRTGPNSGDPGARPVPMQGLEANTGQNPIQDFVEGYSYRATSLTSSNLVLTAARAIQVSFPTREGYQYQVFSSTDFTNWLVASDRITGCGSNQAFAFPATNPAAFYRAGELPPDLSMHMVGLTDVFLDTARLSSHSNQMTVAGMRVQSRDYNFKDYLIATYGLDLCQQCFQLQQLDVITNVGATCGTEPLFFLKDTTNSLVMSNGITRYVEGTTYTSVTSTGQTMTVDMSTAQMLEIVVVSATASVTLMVSDPNGNQLGGFIVPSGGTWYNGIIDGFRPGRYSVRFVPFGASSVTFTLRFRNLNKRGTPTMVSGGTISATLEDYIYDFAKFAISASAGQTLWVTNTPGAAQTLDVCNSLGIRVGGLTGGGTGTPLIVPITKPDIYTILYYHADGAAHSTYSSRIALTP